MMGCGQAVEAFIPELAVLVPVAGSCGDLK